MAPRNGVSVPLRTVNLNVQRALLEQGSAQKQTKHDSRSQHQPSTTPGTSIGTVGREAIVTAPMTFAPRPYEEAPTYSRSTSFPQKMSSQYQNNNHGVGLFDATATVDELFDDPEEDTYAKSQKGIFSRSRLPRGERSNERRTLSRSSSHAALNSSAATCTTQRNERHHWQSAHHNEQEQHQQRQHQQEEEGHQSILVKSGKYRTGPAAIAGAGPSSNPPLPLNLFGGAAEAYANGSYYCSDNNNRDTSRSNSSYHKYDPQAAAAARRRDASSANRSTAVALDQDHYRNHNDGALHNVRNVSQTSSSRGGIGQSHKRRQERGKGEEEEGEGVSSRGRSEAAGVTFVHDEEQHTADVSGNNLITTGTSQHKGRVGPHPAYSARCASRSAAIADDAPAMFLKSNNLFAPYASYASSSSTAAPLHQPLSAATRGSRRQQQEEKEGRSRNLPIPEEANVGTQSTPFRQTYPSLSTNNAINHLVSTSNTNKNINNNNNTVVRGQVHPPHGLMRAGGSLVGVTSTTAGSGANASARGGGVSHLAASVGEAQAQPRRHALSSIPSVAVYNRKRSRSLTNGFHSDSKTHAYAGDGDSFYYPRSREASVVSNANDGCHYASCDDTTAAEAGGQRKKTLGTDRLPRDNTNNSKGMTCLSQGSRSRAASSRESSANTVPKPIGTHYYDNKNNEVRNGYMIHYDGSDCFGDGLVTGALGLPDDLRMLLSQGSDTNKSASCLTHNSADNGHRLAATAKGNGRSTRSYSNHGDYTDTPPSTVAASATSRALQHGGATDVAGGKGRGQATVGLASSSSAGEDPLLHHGFTVKPLWSLVGTFKTGLMHIVDLRGGHSMRWVQRNPKGGHQRITIPLNAIDVDAGGVTIVRVEAPAPDEELRRQQNLEAEAEQQRLAFLYSGRRDPNRNRLLTSKHRSSNSRASSAADSVTSRASSLATPSTVPPSGHSSFSSVAGGNHTLPAYLRGKGGVRSLTASTSTSSWAVVIRTIQIKPSQVTFAFGSALEAHRFKTQLVELVRNAKQFM